MKKLVLSTLVLLAFVFSGYGQVQDNPVLKADGKPENISQILKHNQLLKSSTKEDLGWVFPADAVPENYYQDPAAITGYSNLIFPDSTMQYESDNTWTHCWLHGFGGVFDPYAKVFDPDITAPLIVPGTPYNLDSIVVIARYNKYVAVNDTLLVEIVHGLPRTAPNFRSGIAFTANSFPLSPPFMTSTPALYGPEARLTPPTKTVIKYVLTDADTTMMDSKYILVPVHLPIGANQVIGVHVTFIPGYSYTFGDSLFSYSGTAIPNPTKNSFRALLYAVDATAYPLYFADDHDIIGDNLAYYVNKGVRYQTNVAPNTWRNEVMSGLATWSFPIGYRVSTNTGLDDVVGNIISLNQNQPNPFSDVTTIKYTLSEVADVTFDLFDQTGRKVMNIKKGMETPGMQSIDIDAANLQNGIYFYTLTAGNHKASKKMVVLK